jgi:AraC-like DNA-binding protein
MQEDEGMRVLLARAASLNGFAELVGELGGQSRLLLEMAGLNPDVLNEPDRLISITALSRVLDLAAAQLDCPSFGLLLSQRQGITILGPLGMLMRKSPTFREAFADMQKYLPLHSEAISFELEVNANIAVIRCILHVSGHDHGRQLLDLAMGVGCNIVRMYTGQGWKPRSVYFQHQAPLDLAPYRMVFRAPLLFAQTFNGVVVESRLLDTPVDSFEPEWQQFLGDYLDRLARSRKADMASRVALVIKNLLPRGGGSLTEVADLLGMTGRTLQRRLKAEGTTFQAVLDEVRREVAIAYLQAQTITLTELAQLLGYADLSTFSRAFKHWFGVAPAFYVRP